MRNLIPRLKLWSLPRYRVPRAYPTVKAILVPKVSHPGENHGGIQPISGGDYIRIANRPAWLDDSGSPRPDNDFQPVRKRKEGVGSGNAAIQRQNGFHRAKFRCVHSAHLAGADSQRLSVARVDDGVRFDVLAYPPGEQ